MLVIGPLGRALRGDASIAPYIPFTDGTVERGLAPLLAPFPFIANIKYRCRGRRPRRPGRGLRYRLWGGETPPYEPMENERQYPNG